VARRLVKASPTSLTICHADVAELLLMFVKNSATDPAASFVPFFRPT
jgi:hypothetical protein